MSDVFVLLLKEYVLNLGWQIYTYLDSGHCLYHISTWLPSRDLSWASPYPHYLLIRSSSQSVILLPTQTLKSDALLPNISHHVSGHNQMKNTCTCLAVYVYMCECVCVLVLTVGFLPSLSTVFRLSTPCTVTAPGYKWTASSSDSAELQQDKDQHYKLYTQMFTGEKHTRSNQTVTSNNSRHTLQSNLNLCLISNLFYTTRNLCFVCKELYFSDLTES